MGINRISKKARVALASACLAGLLGTSLPAATVFINSSLDFYTDLDNQAGDLDPTVGVWQTNDDVQFLAGGFLNSNDDFSGSIPNSSARPMTLNIGGSLLMDSNTGIFAENRTQGGTGGNIAITVGNVFSMSLDSIISSSRIGNATAGIKDAGNLSIEVFGDVNLAAGSTLAANDPGGNAGDILLTSQRGSIFIDGLIASGPNTNVQATKLNGFVLQNGATTQRGGDITIRILEDVGSADPNLARITVGTNGIIVSQGEDPASGKITMESVCAGITINGLVASVAKKGNGTTTNSPIVELLSPRFITVNGQDLGGVGPNQGRVRADYIIGEAPEPIGVFMYALANILVNGPDSGALALGNDGDGGTSLKPVFAVSSNGGTATNQNGGTIQLFSIEGDVSGFGQMLQAKATTAGGDGGTIDLQAFFNVLLDTAEMDARGANSGGGPAGGDIFVRAYNGDLIWTNGAADASGAGPASIILKYFGSIDLTGTTFNPAALFSQDTSGGGPVLPDGISIEPCANVIPLPAGFQTGLMGLAGIGAYTGIRRVRRQLA